MITVDSLTKTYGDFTAVDDVTFTARPGRVTGFLGPNGAGKSTTMRVMVGLTPPTSGDVTISGRRSADLPNPGHEVGVLLDASAQHAGRTGREILTIAQRTMGLPKLRVEEMLDRVSLTEDEAGRRVRNYSLGMRQRLGIATALIGRAGGADPRRAGQRARPGGHPVDARPAAGRTPTRAAPSCCPRTCSTRSRSSQTTSCSSATVASSRRAPRPTCCRPPGPSYAAPSAAALARALEGAGIAITVSPDGALRTSADPERVGQVALAAGVALTELRSADGAGLEEMFLELTAESQREGAAA